MTVLARDVLWVEGDSVNALGLLEMVLTTFFATFHGATATRPSCVCVVVVVVVVVMVVLYVWVWRCRYTFVSMYMEAYMCVRMCTWINTIV